MKKSNLIAMMFMIFMIVHSLNAQTQFTYPMKPGDVCVYKKLQGHGTKFISSLFVRAVQELARGSGNGNFDGNNDTVLVESGDGDYYRISRDTNGIVDNVGSISFMSNNFSELTPTNLPIIDTFYIHLAKDSIRCFIIARFDTTIFNQSVHAFRMCVPFKGDSIIQTVADTFGIIKQSHYYPTTELHFILNSAEINRKKYNRDQTKRSYMPLCIGNIYQRLIMLPTTYSYYQTEIISDTSSMNGIQYFKSSLNNLYREDMNGVFKYDSIAAKEQLICPSDASIGTIFTNGVVTDTTTYYWNGKYHRMLIIHRSMTEYAYSEKWIDGLGMFGKHSFNGIDETWNNLIYANVCGEIFGNLVHTKKEYQPIPSIILYQNSPNPFSNSTSISYHLSSRGHVRLEVFDLIGRKVATLVDEEKDVGEYYLKFDIRNPSSAGGFDIHPGVYFYKLSTMNNSQIQKMILIQ